MALQMDIRELERLDQELAQAMGQTPEIKREALAELGRQLLAGVKARIGGTGKVQRWQHVHLGSGGGYVAVHAAENMADEHGRAVGAITNAIESGHKIRPPSGKAERYTQRIHKAKVPAKRMYAGTDMGAAVDQAAANLALRLAQNLEG